MKGHLTMSEKERRRKSLFDNVLEGRMKLVEASDALSLSYRQCKRSYRRFIEEGDYGLVHRNRGRPSNRAKPADFREAVLKRYRERYNGYGPTFASEKLAEDGYVLDHETLRRWLLEATLWVKSRKSRKHRTRRPRRSNFGALVQMDGSHHRWFGADWPKACLMTMVDDATGTTLAMLAHEETTEAAMLLLWQWIRLHGMPVALYTDKKTVFVTGRKPTQAEQLAGIEPATAFGKACSKLGVGIIKAHSPQAKGRVERKHGLFQDRFIKELELRDIKTIDKANEFLFDRFYDDINGKFAQTPASSEDFHRRPKKGTNLANVFCFEQIRTVQNDWIVSYNSNLYQILKEKGTMPRPKDKVIVRTRLDGSVQFVFKERALKFKRLEERPRKPLKTKKAKRKKTWKPAPNHPWRRSYKKAMEKSKHEYNTKKTA
jgi:hypothetical protein